MPVFLANGNHALIYLVAGVMILNSWSLLSVAFKSGGGPSRNPPFHITEESLSYRLLL
jgi:hypothetical protein